MTVSTDVTVRGERPARVRPVRRSGRRDTLAANGAPVKSRGGSATTFVIAIIAVGLLAFAVVLMSGVAAVRQLAGAQAIEQARVLTKIDAHEVELRITEPMVSGFHPDARARLASMVEQVVQPHPGGPVVRVKIWRAHGDVGEVVYSDLAELMGLRETLDEEQRDVLRTGAVGATVADLGRHEEQTEHGLGPLTEVYTRIFTPQGTPLLFETYRRSEAIVDSSRDIAATFTPVVILTLVSAAALQLLLAVALIGRFRHHQHEREALMDAVLDASVKERRKIAGDLHDGPVQEMTGLCLNLSAQAQSETDERVRGAMLQLASTGRTTLRTLRSAIVGLYPPNLEHTGLHAALSDLLTRLPSQEMTAHLDYRVNGLLSLPTSELLYRAGQEAVRNVEKHASASNVWVSVQRQKRSVILSVRDDGAGGASISTQIAGPGRFGLVLLADIIRDAGGRMHLASNSSGTIVTVDVPA